MPKRGFKDTAYYFSKNLSYVSKQNPSVGYSSLFNLKQFQKANKVMFDDAPSVRASLRKIGVACIDPQKIARRVA